MSCLERIYLELNWVYVSQRGQLGWDIILVILEKWPPFDLDVKLKLWMPINKKSLSL